MAVKVIVPIRCARRSKSCLYDAAGDHKIVADVIGRYLRRPGHLTILLSLPGETVNLAGIWNVSIHYIRGVGHQQFVLDQDGNTLTGEQRGEIFQASLHGKVEADHVTLRSMMRPSRYYLPYTFTGTVSGNMFSGDVERANTVTAHSLRRDSKAKPGLLCPIDLVQTAARGDSAIALEHFA